MGALPRTLVCTPCSCWLRVSESMEHAAKRSARTTIALGTASSRTSTAPAVRPCLSTCLRLPRV
jgi:hypothetical protein